MSQDNQIAQASVTTQNAANSHSAALLENLKNSDNSQVAARVFRSNVMSMRYVFKNGKVAAFLSGKYSTDIAHEIQELDAEVAAHHPNINTNPEEIIDTIDPIEALKKKHIEEYLAQQAKSLHKDNDAGNSEQTKLNVANSRTVGDGAAGSDSAVGNANTGDNAGAGLSGLSINLGGRK
jgi:hypothetical protein